MEKNINDIENWSNIPLGFIEEIRKKSEDRRELQLFDLRSFNVNHVDLFCLLKCKVSDTPNGFYTMLQKDKPIGNIFWWDFLIESDLGYIHFFRSQSKIEISTNIDPNSINIEDFVKTNLKKYSKEIDETKKKLEIHSLYVNHYKSYKDCTKKLWSEIKMLKISPEEVEVDLENEQTQMKITLEKFIENNIKFHAVGKSLLLNAAFLIESYLTLLIRVTAKEDLKTYPEILKKHLNSNFSEKLKNLKYYSFIFKSDVDLNEKAIVDTLKVVELRNKYVHADLSSKLNDLGTVFFDDDYPVFPAYRYSPIVENIVRVYQVPTFDTIKFAYDASLEFVKYIDSLFIEDEISNAVRMLMEQNPVGFNQGSKKYSAIFSNHLFDARFR